MGGTDLDLLARYARTRDADAFAELVARHRDMVYSACYRTLGEAADAEDSAQECFLHLARSAGSVRASVGGWLHRVAVRTSMAMRRRDRARRETEGEAASMLADREAEPSWDEIKGEIDGAIDGLPHELREPLVLHFLGGRSQTEIGEELGLSQSAISVRVKKGVELVRRHLKQAGLPLSAAGLTMLLSTRTCQAAPASLVAELGKLAMAGVGSSSAGAGASALGLAALIGSKAKIACVVALSLVGAAAVHHALGGTGRRGAEPAALAPGRAKPQSLVTRQARTPSAIGPKANSQANAVPASADRLRKSKPLGPPRRRDAGSRNAAPEDRAVRADPDISRERRNAAPSAAAPRGRYAVGPELALRSPGPNVATEAVAALAGAAVGATWERDDVAMLRRPQFAHTAAIETPGVALRHLGVDERTCAVIADIVSLANATLRGKFPHLAERDILVFVTPPRGGWYETTTTNRVDTIYIQLGQKGLGEYFRADAGPVGLLCQAVAELHNPQRIPGFDRYVTHRHLVPAVEEEFGPDVLPDENAPPLAADGEEMLRTITSEEYALVHPDFAAAGALAAVEDTLGLDGLQAALTAIPADADVPLTALREAAVAREPALQEAFSTYDHARELELDEDGSCLVTSFEGEGTFVPASDHPLGDLITPLVIRHRPGIEVSRTDEWATHGEHSLRFEAEAIGRWTSLGMWDPDWRFGDLRRFSQLDLDLMVESGEPEKIRVRLHDDVWHGHGQVYLFDGTVNPGEPLHISYPLDEDGLRGAKTWEAPYFDGRLRASEITNLEVMFIDPGGYVALYLDNIRLTPRQQNRPRPPPAPVGGSGRGSRATRVSIERPGVRLLYAQGVNEAYLEPIADIVSAAKRAFQELLPHLAKERISVRVRPAAGGSESTITDREDDIHIRLGPKGLGEYLRADAGPIGILCQAVAELHNPRRMPGLDRYMTHRHLVPAVMAEVEPDALPRENATPLAEDGMPMLELLTDATYTALHPDFAAVGALLAIENEMEWEGLRPLLAVANSDEFRDPFGALTQYMAANQDAGPDLIAALEAYDLATKLQQDEDGTCLIASFEADEMPTRTRSHPITALDAPLVLTVPPAFDMSQSEEWATHGTQSLKLDLQRPGPRASVAINDPDWRFKDWRRFSRFEMDLKLEGEDPQEVCVEICDDIGRGHGQVELFRDIVQPGRTVNIAYALDEAGLQGGKTAEANHFSGRFRAGEVSGLSIMLPDPRAPVTLYIDNLRLTPREEDETEQQWPLPAGAPRGGRSGVALSSGVGRRPPLPPRPPLSQREPRAFRSPPRGFPSLRRQPLPDPLLPSGPPRQSSRSRRRPTDRQPEQWRRPDRPEHRAVTLNAAPRRAPSPTRASSGNDRRDLLCVPPHVVHDGEVAESLKLPDAEGRARAHPGDRVRANAKAFLEERQAADGPQRVAGAEDDTVDPRANAL